MQTVSYTADAENGFRVQASNLPSVHPVQDTPEVAVAKRRHLDQLRRAEARSWQSVKEEQKASYQPKRQLSQRRSGSRNPFVLSNDESRDSPPVRRPANAIILEAVKDYSDRLYRPPTPSPVNLFRRHYVIPAMPAFVPLPMPVLHSAVRHTQDTLGQYEYSYTGDTSAKVESRALDGTTRGAYSYIDPNGILQQVHYIADKDGFRVLATNLPHA